MNTLAKAYPEGHPLDCQCADCREIVTEILKGFKRAWTSRPYMRALARTLTAPLAPKQRSLDHHVIRFNEGREAALFKLEAFCREFLLATFIDDHVLAILGISCERIELRHTGPWPDVNFLICTMPGFNALTLPGVPTRQPRLLCPRER